jgi:electron transfer flavoprotein alpha subunit
MTGDILIVAECGRNAASPVVCELITLARQLAHSARARIGMLALGAAAAEPGAWAARGIDVLYRAGIGADALPETLLAAATEAARRACAKVVLFPHALWAAEAAPRLAFRLGGAMASGCVEVAIEDDTVRCTRACYGGLAREVDEFTALPVVATVRAGVFERAGTLAGREAQVMDLGFFDDAAACTKRVDRRLETESGARLEDAAVIVAGGRGLEGPQGFDLLAELARELGGAVGASRR